MIEYIYNLQVDIFIMTFLIALVIYAGFEIKCNPVNIAPHFSFYTLRDKNLCLVYSLLILVRFANRADETFLDISQIKNSIMEIFVSQIIK